MAESARVVARRARWLRIPADVGALCLVLADVIFGIVTPTFSLHARNLGVGLAALGALNALGGITQLVLAVPLGLLAFAGAGGVPLLLVGRIVFGVAGVAVFQIGTAHLGDITAPGERSFAFGLYATAMGLGFTIGPLLGG